MREGIDKKKQKKKRGGFEETEVGTLEAGLKKKLLQLGEGQAKN